jgi:hypothetical protein
MTSMSSFAKEHGVSVWLIAHPTKQYPREDGTFPKVRGYSISGGAPAYNACDNGLTVEKRATGKTLITSWKSRYPWMGAEGSALLSFDMRSGRYSESEDSKISSLMISELLTPEQRSRSSIVSEDVDVNGVVQRHRVENQTIFDEMLLLFYIEQPQHEAAICFMDVLAKSGMTMRSPNLDGCSHTPAHEVGDLMGQRRMAYSTAYRLVVGECGQKAAERLLRVANNAYLYPVSKIEKKAPLKRISKAISASLWVLAKHYKTDGRRDPRRILKAQVMMRE